MNFDNNIDNGQCFNAYILFGFYVLYVVFTLNYVFFFSEKFEFL